MLPVYIIFFNILAFILIFLILKLSSKLLNKPLNNRISLVISLIITVAFSVYFYPAFESLCLPYSLELAEKPSGHQTVQINNLEMDTMEFGEYLSRSGWQVDYKHKLGGKSGIRRLHAQKGTTNLMPFKRVSATIDYYDDFNEEEFGEFYREYNSRANKSLVDASSFLNSWYEENNKKAVSQRFKFTFKNGYRWEGEKLYSSLAKQLNMNFGTDLPEHFTYDLGDPYCGT